MDKHDLPRPPLTVGIIGAGRVGAVLGAALQRAGHRLIAVSGRSPQSQARIARLLPAVSVRPPERVGDGVDLLVLAVPDDALPSVVAQLTDRGAIGAGQLVAHTSGAYGLQVLAPAAAVGARTFALHPAMTFAGTAADVDLLRGLPFGVTAPAALTALVEDLVGDLGGTVEWIADEDRPLYHAALAHGANHLVTLVNEAADRLRDAGVRRPEALLRPLLATALDNALALGDAALTGPVARGDAGTVAGHLVALGSVAPQSVPPYVALARRTAERALAAGSLGAAPAQRILEVLAADQVAVA